MGKSDRKTLKNNIEISKSLSYILRHGALELGLNIDEGGWVSIEEILSLKQLKHVSLEQIEKIVEENDKKRFELENFKIRAVQGHSKYVGEKINEEELLEEIIEPLEKCIHGTTKNAWELIKNSGLNKMNRMHIHFSIGEPDDENVISGMRNSSQILIYIDMEKAMKNGIKFYKSKNNVILTSEIITPDFFKKVVMIRQKSKSDKYAQLFENILIGK